MPSHTNVDEAAGAPLWSVAAIRREWTDDHYDYSFSKHIPY